VLGFLGGDCGVFIGLGEDGIILSITGDGPDAPVMSARVSGTNPFIKDRLGRGRSCMRC
jgi:hypothetical protein